MIRVVVVVVVFACWSGGCLVGELSGIPCVDDEHCPTQHFCDIPNGSCVAAVDGKGAADLLVTGVRDPLGVVVQSPRVPQEAESELQLIVVNQGGTTAANVELELVRLSCMNLDFDPLDVPATLAAGASAEIAFTVRPDDCSSPSIQDWFFFYSGRAKRGTFNILPDSAPPSGD